MHSDAIYVLFVSK